MHFSVGAIHESPAKTSAAKTAQKKTCEHRKSFALYVLQQSFEQELYTDCHQHDTACKPCLVGKLVADELS